MLRTRVLTAVILSCMLLAGLFLLPPAWAVFGFGAAFTIGAWEWGAFGALRGTGSRLAYAAGVALLLLAAWRWTEDPQHLLLLLGSACAWWAIAWAWLALYPSRQHPVLVLACGLPVLVPAFIAVARLEVSAGNFGPQFVLWLVLMVIAADIGAYFAGRSLGRRRLAPRVSPAKTLEGAVGGLGAVALVGWGGAKYFGLSVPVAVVFGCAVGVFSIVGDLTESMFKRAAGLKDSGTLLPGHGGLLDRIDSLTAAAPLYALGLFGSGVIA